MLISVIIQIRSKLNDRIVKSDAILMKLGGKTYIKKQPSYGFPRGCMVIWNNYLTILAEVLMDLYWEDFYKFGLPGLQALAGLVCYSNN